MTTPGLHSSHHRSEAFWRAALENADDLVWVFSAQVDWWNRPGSTVLPSEYRVALDRPQP
jgi:hypothetical protein